jgi:hypothetical protein
VRQQSRLCARKNPRLRRSTAATTEPPVTFESPCSCRDNHGKDRWAAKNDASLPPSGAREVQVVTPSEIFSWHGPTARLTRQSKRIAAENRWYALTGRVVDLKVEADGDIHIALRDASGNKPGIVGAEVPAKTQWCPIRKVVFGWTRTKFPFRIRSNKTLRINQSRVITVIGKAFFRR